MHSATNVCLILNPECPQHLASFDSSDINGEYSQLLLERDCCLSLALEETLRDVILADVSDYGIDLAVGKIFVSYQPGTHRWERLQYQNACWLACKTEATLYQPSQTVQINLLNGELRVAGQLLGSLPSEIRDSPECQQIFCDVCIYCDFW